MRPHRLSYLRTALGGFLLSASAASVAVYWLLIRKINIPVLNWSPDRLPLMYWFSIGVVLVLAVFCFLVGVGGVLSLQRDARESRQS